MQQRGRDEIFLCFAFLKKDFEVKEQTKIQFIQQSKRTIVDIDIFLIKQYLEMYSSFLKPYNSSLQTINQINMMIM